MDRKRKLKRTALGLQDALLARYGFDIVPFVKEGLEARRTLAAIAAELETSPPQLFQWLRELGYRTHRTIIPVEEAKLVGSGRR
jgi:hypothetical protein